MDPIVYVKRSEDTDQGDSEDFLKNAEESDLQEQERNYTPVEEQNRTSVVLWREGDSLPDFYNGDGFESPIENIRSGFVSVEVQTTDSVFEEEGGELAKDFLLVKETKHKTGSNSKHSKSKKKSKKQGRGLSYWMTCFCGLQILLWIVFAGVFLWFIRYVVLGKSLFTSY